MSKEEDLEKTKSLENLNDINEKNIYEEYDNLFRERKYSNLQENLDSAKDLENSEVDENGDIIENNETPVIETLTFDDDEQKNIVEDVNKVLNKDKKQKKDNIFKKMLAKFKSLSKKKKILVISLGILFLIAIVGVICLFVIKDENKNEETKKEEEKDVIVIKDNYIYKNGNLIFLDEEDNEIGTYECTNKDENLCYTAYQGTNEDNFYKVTPLYEDETEILSRINLYFNRYAFVYDNKNEDKGMISLYDFKNNQVISQYNVVKTHHINDKDYIITEEDGIYKLYEMTETGLESRIDKDYKYLGLMDNKETNYVIAKVPSGYYLLDLNTGDEVSKLIGKQIFNYNDDYIVTVSDDVYSLYTYENAQKLTGYKFINIENSSYIVSVDKNNNLFYRDMDLVKINEEGFKLNNDNYLPKKIYSSSGILQENIYAFESNYGEDKITIAIRDDEVGTDYFKSTSLKEYAYNKTISNYSYNDGVLYFYSDENKEALVGKYVCKNKNEEFKEGELLANCHPALDTIYEDNDMTINTDKVSMIPIINNRYVFVYDGTVNNPNVVLYDLEDDKSLNYESVNTYTEANNGVLTYSKVDSINVIVKSKKDGKYGMININKDGITSVYDFIYDSMEMINGKVLVTSNGKSKILYSKISTSKEFPGKIRGFIGDIEYYKVKEGSNYYVYDNEGDKVTDKGYKYVELYDNFYAGVNGSSLMLYDYTGKECIEKVIELYSENYYGKEANAFIIAVNNQKVTVSVYKDGSYTHTNVDIIENKQETDKNKPSDEEQTGNNANEETTASEENNTDDETNEIE